MTKIGKSGLCLLLGASMIVCGCVKSDAQSPIKPSVRASVMQSAVRVGVSHLRSDAGLPVVIEYFNIEGNLKAIGYRMAQEHPKSNGWKQTTTDDMEIFTCGNPQPGVKWQRIAIFKGRLDSKFQTLAKTDKTWVNVIVYRVRNG